MVVASFFSSPPPLLNALDDNSVSLPMTLPLGIFTVVIFLVGGCFGYCIGIKQQQPQVEIAPRKVVDKLNDRISCNNKGQLLQHDKDKRGNGTSGGCDRSSNNGQVISNTNTEDDGPAAVLHGSLSLLSSMWNDKEHSKHDKVVEYLSPEEMTRLLFSEVRQQSNGGRTIEGSSVGVVGGVSVEETLRLDEAIVTTTTIADDNSDISSPRSSATDLTNILTTTATSLQTSSTTTPTTANQTQTPQSFLSLLSLIQQYSVNTSHPYFFNQLFGSLDPIALAAEIVALSVNTSVYTYETAPVFTLLEREVMWQVGRLVFGNKVGDGTKKNSEVVLDGGYVDVDDSNVNDSSNSKTTEEEEEEEEFEGEGLMIPGGSLANLTAMHAARHRWKVMNGYTAKQEGGEAEDVAALDGEDKGYWTGEGEEKKLDDGSALLEDDATDHQQQQQQLDVNNRCSQKTPHQRDTLREDDQSTPHLVAFVSDEAHYSFSKSARVLGMRDEDLIVIPTCSDGRMDVEALAKRIEDLEYEVLGGGLNQHRKKRRVPFFVACTAGSTVRGSFDDIAEIVQVCRDYECRGNSTSTSSINNDGTATPPPPCKRTIWVHVDGAWGGSAIFSSRPQVRSATHMDEIRHADSFTFNPHKMLGAPQQTTAFIVRHRNALRNANAAGARYLFDPRKNGAEYDLGDLSYTCGRRTDAVKLWALWKYYGRAGLGARVDQKVDELEMFVRELRKRPGFALACKPWPFNVNFFYFPPRIRDVLKARGLLRGSENVNEDEIDDYFLKVPDDIAQDLANVSVTLKLRMHEAGEIIIPYQVRSKWIQYC